MSMLLPDRRTLTSAALSVKGNSTNLEIVGFTGPE